ncbi:MAG: ATP-binding cassette domain-containing protein [Cyclobacteriaceae bacterium]
MSEEILKALTQLFAIITKQDGGVTETERDFVIRFFQQELDQDSVQEYLELYDKYVGYNQEEKDAPEKKERKSKLTSVKDSVRTLGICKKINKTLTQKQKVVVLVKLLELVGSDGNFTSQRMEIIDTVSTVFKVGKDEYKLIESFVLKEDSAELSFADVLVVSPESRVAGEARHMMAELEGEITFMNVRSVDMYFVKYIGPQEVVLNGFIMKSRQVYLFSHGSTIKTPLGSALYYSDLISQFISEFTSHNISFTANDLEFRFPNGGIGLRDINISEGPGRLLGIMGASGAGKTTLLNVLAGIEKPSSGEVLINGFSVHSEKERIEGVVGYVAQDDLLIEELTVYQNLYYNARLCFADMSEEELDKRVMDVLTSLGLEQRKDLKVGSVLDKTISGGQRKRLNIALELIREPAVLFVDEPTSGLSSRDSENVIDLLKELSLKGKLIFVVIHQPSSDIYKMFDKMYLLDTGGYPVFYGNPVEAVTYFKSITNQVDRERGQCHTCGNVNPEQIFNIIEAKVVDEYGQLTNKRKVNPQKWHDFYKKNFNVNKVAEVKEVPPKALNIPNKLKQTVIFTTRDMLSKLSNRQYLLINLLEAPVLAIILAFIIRYKSAPGEAGYLFRFNENIPAFMLMSIVVALFMGLSVSAEEIIRDRKILRRESFLNLSWNSYLSSKVVILFLMSAIQTFTFVLIGHFILEIQGMTIAFWMALFTVSCFANVLGLNISSAFNSAVTVYILIPMLLIPQMILSGLLFSFDKLNDTISTRGKVPVVADMMASRWAYEAMTVYQYKNNPYQSPIFTLEQRERQADFKAAFFAGKLREKIQNIMNNLDAEDDSTRRVLEHDLYVLRSEIQHEDYKEGLEGIDLENDLTPSAMNKETEAKIRQYIVGLEDYYKTLFNDAVTKKEKMVYLLEQNYDYDINDYKNRYFNESLSDLVRNVSVKERILEYDGKLIQQIDPIFLAPEAPDYALDYRAHFFAPTKHLFGRYFDTYGFNLAVIWVMTILLYAMLYFKVLDKGLRAFGKLKFKK